MPPCGVGLKCPVSFVAISRRLIIQSGLDPPPRIRAISDPSQSRQLLGQAPGFKGSAGRKGGRDCGRLQAGIAPPARRV